MAANGMHDWSLLKLAVDWPAEQVQLDMRSPDGPRVLVARKLKSLVVPNENPWGPSISINGATGPALAETGLNRLTIEMQSGDLIEIVAAQFQTPEG